MSQSAPVCQPAGKRYLVADWLLSVFFPSRQAKKCRPHSMPKSGQSAGLPPDHPTSLPPDLFTSLFSCLSTFVLFVSFVFPYP
jgi:hypothetical protein